MESYQFFIRQGMKTSARQPFDMTRAEKLDRCRLSTQSLNMDDITTNTAADAGYLAETNAANRKRQLADRACAQLEAATPFLINAIRSGKASPEIENLLCSLWSGELCKQLTSLDTDTAGAVLAMIAARIHGGEEADCLLATILYHTGGMPPTDRDSW